MRISLCGAVLVVMLSARPVSAQSGPPVPPAPPAPQALRLDSPEFARLVGGKKIEVVTIEGDALAGRVVALSPTVLTLSPGFGSMLERPVALDQIRRVQRPSHRILYASLIGIGSMVTWGFADIENPMQEFGPLAITLMGVTGWGVGALVGKIIDESRKERDLIYERPRKSTVSFAPILSRTRAGIRVSITLPRRR